MFTITSRTGAWATWHAPGRVTCSSPAVQAAVLAALASTEPLDRPAGVGPRTLDRDGPAYLVLREALRPVRRVTGDPPDLGPSGCVPLPSEVEHYRRTGRWTEVER